MARDTVHPHRVDEEGRESIRGVNGDHPCCGADAPLACLMDGIQLRDPIASVPCTRKDGHDGDHVAGHALGFVLARWSRLRGVN
jgi:hypothetical protein